MRGVLARLALPWMFASLVACFASSARAEEARPAALSWVRMPGAESCIAAHELAAAVEARLGRSALVPPAAADVVVEGRVERHGNAWRVTIVTTRADGEKLGSRVLESKEASCRALDDAVVLVVALAIDPEGKASPPKAPDPPPPPPAAPRVEVVEHVRVVEKPVVVEGPPRWSGELRLGGMASAGVLPGVAPGARITLEVAHRALLPLDLGFGIHGNADAASGKGATVGSVDLALGLCPKFGDALRVHVCGGVGVEQVHARGYGFDVVLDRSRVAADLRLGVRVSRTLFGPWFVGIGAEGILSLVRPRFVYDRPDGSSALLYERPWLGGALELALGIRVPS